MSGASTRRAALGAILAIPLAPVPAIALTADIRSDPHVAREAEARALYRHHRDTEWGWSTPGFSPACRAASEAHGAVMDFAREACAMPRPTTLAGLGALALSIALAEELSICAADRSEPAEDGLRALVEAVLAVTGTVPPPDWRGFVYVPEESAPCA